MVRLLICAMVYLKKDGLIVVNVSYLGKVWEVDSFQDFASQVQSYYKADFVTGWALGLTEADYIAKKGVYEGIQLKALANFWRSL